MAIAIAVALKPLKQPPDARVCDSELCSANAAKQNATSMIATLLVCPSLHAWLIIAMMCIADASVQICVVRYAKL
jgi:hypothetical protein